MKILNISGYDTIGAIANGYVLHKEYARRGHESHMAVMHRFDFKDPNIHALQGRFTKYINYAPILIEKQLSLYSILPIAAFQLYYQRYYREAEIIHLHLPHATSFYSLFNLPLMGNHKQRPLVLTIHDMFFMTGLCHQAMECERWLTGCGNCPDLNRTFAVKNDNTAFMWKIKKEMFQKTHVTLVVGSEWTYEKVKRSPILAHLPCQIIPFGIDTNNYHLQDKSACRARLGIPKDAHVIALRLPPNKPNMVIKGVTYLEQALASLELRKKAYLVIFEGKEGLDSLREKYIFKELGGWVNDPQDIAYALGAADIFLMPSLAESFGLMAIESLACGTPVIVFEGTALPQTVRAPFGGLAVPHEAGALAMATKELLINSERRQAMIEYGTNIVLQEHSLDKYVSRHLALYHELSQGTE